jgi:hypothetical protein
MLRVEFPKWTKIIVATISGTILKQTLIGKEVKNASDAIKLERNASSSLKPMNGIAAITP